VSTHANLTETPKARLQPPELARLGDRFVAMSVVAQLIASGTANTKPTLAKSTGLARSTIDSHLAQLSALGLVMSDGVSTGPRRGRPAERHLINPNAGAILVFDITPNHVRLAVAGTDQRLLADERSSFALDVGPEKTLAFAVERVDKLLSTLGIDRQHLAATVVSLPGPVDTRRGVPVRPPIMPGWDDFGVADYMRREFDCPCVVDNDANIMAIGEARVLPSDQCPMLVIKVGTGIGGGLVTAQGTLHRGADGAACDIGHLRVPGDHDVICACGNVGCIEALASAAAIARRLGEMTGRPDLNQADLREMLRTGDPLAVRLIREASALLGETVASLINVYNPARLVLSGPLTAMTDDLLAGVRAVAYQRALPLATRNLTLTHSVIGDLAGVVGGVVLGIEQALSPESLRSRSVAARRG
jgi:predicted NBD/HSP70 family sugar kinase